MGTEKKDQQERQRWRENDELERKGSRARGGFQVTSPNLKGKDGLPSLTLDFFSLSRQAGEGRGESSHRVSAVHAALTLALSQREREKISHNSSVRHHPMAYEGMRLLCSPRGSAPPRTIPRSRSTQMPNTSPSLQSSFTSTLWPRAASS